MRSHCIEPDWPAPANITALVTLRTGGHSLAPYRSFNLAAHVGDDDAAVAANRSSLARSLPWGARVQWLNQVHGTNVVEAGNGDATPVADAAWSRLPGRACAVLTADCLPVLLCSRGGDVVAAAHAGWRGLLGGVLENTVAAMGADPRELLAWLGPAIGPAAFEVGPEVRSAFVAAAPSAAAAATGACFHSGDARPGHYLADLYGLARLRLNSLQIGSVYGAGYCTLTEADRYFSYRRDGCTGRMASLILINPANASAPVSR
jgi:YfiH family protein